MLRKASASRSKFAERRAEEDPWTALRVGERDAPGKVDFPMLDRVDCDQNIVEIECHNGLPGGQRDVAERKRQEMR